MESSVQRTRKGEVSERGGVMELGMNEALNGDKCVMFFGMKIRDSEKKLFAPEESVKARNESTEVF